MLTAARDVAAGAGDAATLLRLVDQLLQEMEPARQRFFHQAYNNAEVAQETIPHVLQAFDGYRQGLQDMRQALCPADVTRLVAAVEAVEEAAAVIRSARQGYRESVLRGGPTPIVYINRLLTHIDAVIEGTAGTGAAAAALADFMRFRSTLRTYLSRQSEHFLDRRALEEADSALSDLGEVVASIGQRLSQPQDLVSPRQQLVAIAQRLAAVLSVFVEQELAAGSTPLFVANFALSLASAYRGGLLEPTLCSDLVGRVMPAVHSLEEYLVDGPSQEALRRLIQAFSWLRNAVSQNQPLQVAMAMARLRQEACTLADLCGGETAEEADEGGLDLWDV